MLGLRAFPVVAEAVGDAVYAVPVLLYLLLADRLRPRLRRSRASVPVTG